MKLTLPQQSLNLLRGYLDTPGWAKTTKLQYVGGELVANVLPEVDTTWVKNEREVALLTREQRKAYRDADQAWCAKPIDLEISDRQRETIRTCLEKLTEAGALGANKWNFPLFETFGFKPDA